MASSAIPILRPTTSDFVPGAAAGDGKKDKKLCRNVLIYGQCRFEDTGCLFSHDANAPPSPTTAAAAAPSTQFSVASAANAAVFVPNFGSGSASAPPAPLSAAAGVGGAGAQEFIPRRVETPTGVPGLSSRNTPSLDTGQRGGDNMHEYFNHAMELAPNPEAEWIMQQQQQQQEYDYANHQAHQAQNGGQVHDPSGGGYYSSQPHQQAFTRHPLQYHLYHPTSSSTTAQQNPSFFLPPALHQHLTTKSEATHLAPSVDMKLPDDVGGYTGLLPLDKAGGGGGGSENGWAGYRSWLYKAWKVGQGAGQGGGDGRVYVLRRIEGFRLQHEAAISVVDKWTRVRHPGLVAVREAFTTRAFGDHSLVVVFDFHPLAQTLYEAHLSPHAALPPNPWSASPRHSPTPFHSRRPGPAGVGGGLGGAGGGGIGLPERVLWSYVVQLGSAIKAVHSSGLAVRGLEANRVLVTGKNRVRIGGGGVLDVLAWDGSLAGGYQQDDLLSFGKLILSLACGSPASVHNLPKSVDHIARVYAPDLKNVVLYLLSKPGPRKTIDEVLALMGGRVLDELNSSFVAEDSLEAELMREVENGRLVRLLTKFGFINERPEFDHDPRWAETGDRYIIKLFRDYVFHQVDENGRPVTDLSHVITSLNKVRHVSVRLPSEDTITDTPLAQDGRSTTNGSANGSGASSSSGYPRQPKASGSASAASGAGAGAGASSQLQSPHPHEVTSFIQTSFIPAVAPTQDELQAKDAAFLYLETFVERVAPGATLRPFGSMVNGFALRNSDMDLCCFQSEDGPTKSAAELVELLGRLIQAETNFQVKMLPRARIPIIKLTMPPTDSFPFHMACDIGFENGLALENTRLLHTYAKVDPRLKTMVLFLKVWTKKRQINNPYRGTLSSYGYVLLVIHFLTHVKSPAVLPNLQRLPLSRAYRIEELSLEGNDIYFFDDLDALPRFWQTSNHESVGELLIEFFRYFSSGFNYGHHVLSIRSESGFLTKDSKGWFTDPEYDPEVIVRDLHKLCIEDPFQQDYNVARTVTRDGLYTIRGEFTRAFRTLTDRSSKRVPEIIRELCEEREDSILPHPPSPLQPPLRESRDRYAASPRRRSAPSPRLGASQTQVPLPSVMSDFRAWAAMHGVNGAAGLGTGGVAYGRGGPLDTPAQGQQGGSGTGTNPIAALDEAWEQLSPSSLAYSQLYPHHPPPNQYHASSSSSSSSHQHSNNNNSNSNNSHSHPSSNSNSSSQRRHPPDSRRPHLSSASAKSASRPASPPPSLERRVSWDGSGSASTTPNGYDFHRFFQNQPGDESNGAAAHPHPHPAQLRSTLTAPSSPDLGSALHYSAFGSTYRYQGHPHVVGPRLSKSAGPARYTAPPSSTGAIFPEQDREALAIANSITFGNFPPPFSTFPSSTASSHHPHHPAAYPYASSSGPSSVYGASSTDRTSPTTSSFHEDDDVNLNLSLHLTNGRGRDAVVATNGNAVLDPDRGPRQRGRSVPHVRVDSEGRESILFGEIATVLPRASAAPSPAPSSPPSCPPSPSPSPSEADTIDLVESPLSSSVLVEEVIPTFTTSPPTPQKPPAATLQPLTATGTSSPTPTKRMSSPPTTSPYSVLPTAAAGLSNGIARLKLEDESEMKGG
ncbi:hypothetical protein RQP46_002369 [Phenoliferia psychrophenolica]